MLRTADRWISTELLNFNNIFVTSYKIFSWIVLFLYVSFLSKFENTMNNIIVSYAAPTEMSLVVTRTSNRLDEWKLNEGMLMIEKFLKQVKSHAKYDFKSSLFLLVSLGPCGFSHHLGLDIFHWHFKLEWICPEFILSIFDVLWM